MLQQVGQLFCSSSFTNGIIRANSYSSRWVQLVLGLESVGHPAGQEQQCFHPALCLGKHPLGFLFSSSLALPAGGHREAICISESLGELSVKWAVS